MDVRGIRHRRLLPPHRGRAGADELRTDLALDALEMGIWTREHAHQDLSQLRHPSDRGARYRAVRCTQRLAETGAVAAVGSHDASYDNALAEAFNSLVKAEPVRNKGPCRSIDDLETAVAEYIDWFHQRRLHGEIGMIPPVEAEQSLLRFTYSRRNNRAGHREPPLNPGRNTIPIIGRTQRNRRLTAQR
jgi:transposase InsO family protein